MTVSLTNWIEARPGTHVLELPMEDLANESNVLGPWFRDPHWNLEPENHWGCTEEKGPPKFHACRPVRLRVPDPRSVFRRHLMTSETRWSGCVDVLDDLPRGAERAGQSCAQHHACHTEKEATKERPTRIKEI